MKIISYGPSLGTLQSRPVPSYIVWEDGSRYVFDRISNLDSDGSLLLSTLASNECVIAPGLIYHREPTKGV